MLKKNIANRPAATTNIATFPARTVFTAKIERRTSGSVERLSITTKAMSRTTARPRNPSTSAEPHPASAERTIP